MNTRFDGKPGTALFPSKSGHPAIMSLQEMGEKFDGKPHSACFPSK